MLTFESLIAQVRRRRLIRTTLLYILSAWLIVQFAFHILPILNWPLWIGTVLLVAAIVAFPFVLKRAVSKGVPAPPTHEPRN